MNSKPQLPRATSKIHWQSLACRDDRPMVRLPRDAMPSRVIKPQVSFDGRSKKSWWVYRQLDLHPLVLSHLLLATDPAFMPSTHLMGCVRNGWRVDGIVWVPVMGAARLTSLTLGRSHNRLNCAVSIGGCFRAEHAVEYVNQNLCRVYVFHANSEFFSILFAKKGPST